MMPQKAPHSSSPDRKVPRRLASPAPPAMSPAQAATGPGWHQPGVSSPSLWVTKARHHTVLAPTGGTGTPGVHRGSTWPAGKRPQGSPWPWLCPLYLATVAGTRAPPCARAQGRALQKPGLAHMGTAVDMWHTAIYRHTQRLCLQRHTQIYGHTHTFISTDTHLFTGIPTCLQAHTPVYRYTHVSARTHRALQACTPAHTAMPTDCHPAPLTHLHEARPSCCHRHLHHHREV